MGDVPGGYFIGRPQQPQGGPAVQESKPANTQTPGDYFMGTPQQHQQPKQEQSSGSDLKRTSSSSKWCCFGGSEVQN
ncbi:hypothetical protein EJB05_28439 [Eragrostis curvula]|uniref:Uncharacterized protein n=1 Tax=Eragrostis curvula TaxID=38414 RepID=A0A5J9URF8_9POAL|nr:hypothetical protein EJB05_28439 [Eragrostis curvula]